MKIHYQTSPGDFDAHGPKAKYCKIWPKNSKDYILALYIKETCTDSVYVTGPILGSRAVKTEKEKTPMQKVLMSGAFCKLVPLPITETLTTTSCPSLSPGCPQVESGLSSSACKEESKKDLTVAVVAVEDRVKEEEGGSRGESRRGGGRGGGGEKKGEEGRRREENGLERQKERKLDDWMLGRAISKRKKSGMGFSFLAKVGRYQDHSFKQGIQKEWQFGGKEDASFLIY